VKYLFFWGHQPSHDRRARSPDRWKGLNLLGYALMDAREKLREDPE
jgi:predicted NAD-dependent protein-ADP-ribosyltransferase YbiA (DUF1768 family)